jgi:hypothetical protein
MNLAEKTPGREDASLSVVHVISLYELEKRPQLPSEVLREHEARLVGELARMTHLDRRRFVDWPTIHLADRGAMSLAPYLEVRATVKARSL